MLSQEIKDRLLEIKFKEDIFAVLDEIASQHPVQLFISPNKFQPESRLNKPFGVVFKVSPKAVDDVKQQLRTKLPSVYNHYEVDQNGKHVGIAVIRPTDKYELLRILGTNSEEKHDLDTGTLLARLRRWEEEYGLELLGAGVNWIKFSIEKIPGELREFVEELVNFAPGTLSDATITEIEKQIKELKVIRISW